MTAMIQPSSVSRGIGVGAQNRAFGATVRNVDQKILLIGAALAANTTAVTYTANTPTRVYSPDQVGKLAGFGSAVHRAAIGVFRGNGYTTQVWAAIQAEQTSPAAVAGTGTLAITHASTETGVLYVYIDGTRYDITITADDDVTEIGDLIVAKLTADPDCPVTGVNTGGSIALTSKNKGTMANEILIAISAQNEPIPAGVTYTVTPMASGANDPAVSSVLTVMGAGENANNDGFTDIVVCYDVLGTTTMDALSEYNGTGNEIEGCYLDTVHRPFVAWWGDVAASSGGLSALTAIGTTRKELDRTNIAIPVPDSVSNVFVIAGQAAGICASMAQYRPSEPYGGKVMTGILPGTTLADQWTSSYANRDTAVKAGISTTKVVGGAVQLNDVVTMYHPSTISFDSNGYRCVRDVKILLNILTNFYDRFNSDEWKGITIVKDSAKVSSIVDRQKVRDRDAVFAEIVSLVNLFESHAWIYSAEWTTDIMGANLDSYVALRSGGLGFDVVLPLVFSGKLEIFSGLIQFDTNVTIAA